MKIILAEKPGVAKSIAAIVGATSKKDGYLEGNGYAVTWAFGHLVGLAMPEEYGFTSFRAENLPILPQTFILKPRQVKEGNTYRDDPGAVKQLEVIRGLFGRADRIIEATDSAREGELIFRMIYHYLGCTKPFDRLWISSLTDKAIREGLDRLRPGQEYDNLYLSARARSRADWTVGVNSSRALAIAAGKGVWSLGRVQTPTLAIICSRYLENKNFASQAYFRLKLQLCGDATAFTALSSCKYGNKDEAVEHRDAIPGAGTATIVRVERKEVNERPPLPYDLTGLQKEANSKHGFSADKTLSIAQALYEAALTTYPRTGSRHIPTDMMEEIPGLIAGLKSYGRFAGYAAAMDTAVLNTRAVDDAKITDHHAILITGKLPGALSADERTIYDMIAGRMLEAFSPICRREVTAVWLECAGREFTARGSVILSPGWMAVFGAETGVEEEKEDQGLLPALSEGQSLPVRDCRLLEKQTGPRPLHTEASLLSSMETCGGNVENEQEREAMKESGIGTPATRAAIIETILSRGYIVREKKSLVPTAKGMAVYEAVKDKKIADAALTGRWELALSEIAGGKGDDVSFHRGIETYTAQIVRELLLTRIEQADDRPAAACPKCGGKMVFHPKTAKCQNPDCGLTVFRAIAAKELNDAQLSALMGKGRTPVIKGFKARSGKTFDAAVTFDAEFRTVFDFEQVMNKQSKTKKK